MNKNILVITLILAGLSLIIIGLVWQIIDMLIDHQCYQLQPNDFYESTICERYWKK